uniref:Transposase (Putative), gypsy type n=1 Tax=Tanacetum cinerariifolium TaxID=118510 RepID=A0A699H5G5_TANCI|nr:hypothetical protein [Tanacetum cinerariifolium]
MRLDSDVRAGVVVDYMGHKNVSEPCPWWVGSLEHCAQFLAMHFLTDVTFGQFNGVFVKRDPLPTNDVVDLPLVEVLDENRTITRKYPELFLSIVGLSRSFVDTDVQMGLLNFFKYLDPFKVKTRERNRAENEVPLLEEIVDIVISPSAKTIQLFDLTIDDELKAVTRKKKRKVAFNAVSPPVKKARDGGIVISEPNPTTDGKSPAVMKKLIDHSGQGDDKLVRTHPTSTHFVVLSSNSEPLDTEVQIKADTISPKVASPILNVGVTRTSSVPRDGTRGSSSVPDNGSQLDDFFKS